MADALYRMSALETAAGWVPGGGVTVPVRDAAGQRESPREALAALLRPALATGNCFVSFSGGRDSATLLAVAVDTARREGLQPPIPLTQVFMGVPDAAEHDHQEKVIRHLGLQDWVRIPIGEELDVLGPRAQQGLRRFGVVWPISAHLKWPLLDHARGGVLVTGNGGDEVFGGTRITPVAAWLSGHRSSRVMRGAIQGLRPRLGRMGHRAASRATPPWLTPAAQRTVARCAAEEWRSEPVRWDRAVRALATRRATRVGLANLQHLAREWEVVYLHPLLQPRFIEAAVADAGWIGYASRSQALHRLVGDLLPETILTRRSKASFNTAVFRSFSRQFVEPWEGQGVDAKLVRPDALRTQWTSARPAAGSLFLLQQAWLRSRAPM